MERLGPYRILRTIAMGGMGEVFLAALERAGGFEKHVALKCVLPALMEDPRFVELFEREARLAAALTHRNIVQIFDFGQDQGRSWLAMEYVRGVDLKAVMDLVDGPLPLGLVVEIGIACARGLDYAHRARDARGNRLAVIHRDVSPQNVLLSFEGDVKLADFGLAQAAATKVDENRALQGKFAYMSPEQAEGQPLDGRTDQFSLGTVLFELVSGHRAFFADDGAQAILGRVVEGAPLEPLASIVPDLHPAIREVITRAMARNRADRYSDAGALGEALSTAAAQAGVLLGVPPLGTWLRAQFPHRDAAAVPQGVDPMEATAVATDPIGSEHTAAAVDPISAGSNPSSPPLEQTAAAVDPIIETAPFDRSEVKPADQASAVVPDATSPPDPPSSAREMAPSTSGGWSGVVVAVSLLVILGSWWQWGGTSVSGTDAAVEADALAVVSTRSDGGRATDQIVTSDEARVEVSADGQARPPLDQGTPKVPDARPRRDARLRRDARTRRRRISRRDGTVRRRPAPARDVGLPVPLPPPDAAPASAQMAVDASPPPSGPRMRVRAQGGTVRVGGKTANQTWSILGARGVLIEAKGKKGPHVSARVVARGGRFVANIRAQPYGNIFLDGRSMGESPKAGIPLKQGGSTLLVRTADGNETEVVVELAH